MTIDWKTRAEKAEAALRRLHEAVVENRAAAEVLHLAKEAFEDGEVVKDMDALSGRNLRSMKELDAALASAQSLTSSLKESFPNG